MRILTWLLGALGLTPKHGATGAAASSGSGARAALPELTSETEEGFCDLVLRVGHRETLPMGSQVLRASALHEGRRVALEVVFGPEWTEGTLADRPNYRGLVTYRSVGPESDALLRIIDELYGTKAAPSAMAKLTDFTCITLGGDPRDLTKGPVQAKLFFDPGEEGGEGYAELYTNVDLAESRLEIREKDPEYREAIVRALTVAKPG
jgi:hypothetical protein